MKKNLKRKQTLIRSQLKPKRYEYICSIQYVQYESDSQYQTTLPQKSGKHSDSSPTKDQYTPKPRIAIDNDRFYDLEYDEQQDYLGLQIPKKFPDRQSKTIGFLYDHSRLREDIQAIVMEQPPKLSKLQHSSYLQKTIFTQDCLKESYQEAQIAFISKNVSQQFVRCLIKRSFLLGYKIIESKCCVIQEEMDKIELNRSDAKGFCPVHLACLSYIFCKFKGFDSKNSLDLAKFLIYHPDVTLSTSSQLGWNALQDALFYKNVQLSTHLFKASYLKKRSQYVQNFKRIAQYLQSIQDFCFQIDVKVNSYIPFVSNFTPTDTLKIWKYKNSLRFDYTLVGYQNLSCKRRNITILFNHRPQVEGSQPSQKQNSIEGFLTIVNHTKKQVVDFFQEIRSEEMLLIIQDLLTHQMKKYDPSFQTVSLRKQTSLFANEIIQEISGYKAVKHAIVAKYTSKTSKRQPIKMEKSQESLAFLKSFQAYQNYKFDVPIKRKNRHKSVNLELWLIQSYGISFVKVAKIFDILGISHQFLQIASNFITKYMLSSIGDKFPIKIDVPLDYSLYFQILFKPVSKKVPPEQFFKLPSVEQNYQKVQRCNYQKTMQGAEKRLLLSTLFTK